MSENEDEYEDPYPTHEDSDYEASDVAEARREMDASLGDDDEDD